MFDKLVEAIGGSIRDLATANRVREDPYTGNVWVRKQRGNLLNDLR
jgi:hypothetical protein